MSVQVGGREPLQNMMVSSEHKPEKVPEVPELSRTTPGWEQRSGRETREHGMGLVLLGGGSVHDLTQLAAA